MQAPVRKAAEERVAADGGADRQRGDRGLVDSFRGRRYPNDHSALTSPSHVGTPRPVGCPSCPDPPALLAAAVARLSLSPKQIAAFMKRVDEHPNVTRPLVPSGRYAVIDSRAELYRRELRAAGLDPNAKFESPAGVA